MDIELPDDLSQRVEDALYVSVGFGVLAWQRAQVRRRELERLLARRRSDDQGSAGTTQGRRSGPGA